MKEELLERIIVDPGIMLGKPVIKGTRLTVEVIVEKLAYGETIADIINPNNNPFFNNDQIPSISLFPNNHE